MEISSQTCPWDADYRIQPGADFTGSTNVYRFTHLQTNKVTANQLQHRFSVFWLMLICLHMFYIYTVYIFNTKTNLVKYLIIRIFIKTFCVSHHCKIRLLLAAFHIRKDKSNVHHCASSHITLQPKTGSPSWELRTASPRGRYGERLQRDSCLKIHM